MRADLDKLEIKRKPIWLYILEIDQALALKDYNLATNLVKTRLPQEIHESIDVDVVRTFNNMQNLSH